MIRTYSTPKTDHTPGGWEKVSSPTCTKDGRRERHCTECGKVTETEKIEKYGHNGSWQTTTPATCTREGLKEKKCLLCGKILDSKTIKQKEHKYAAATCTSPQKCKECGDTIGSSLGHLLSGGYIDYDDMNHAQKCDRCSYLKLLNHAFKKGVCRICGHDEKKDKFKSREKMSTCEMMNEGTIEQYER